MANPKCKCCNKELKRSTAFKEEYINPQTLKVSNRYFCNQECFDKFHLDYKIKENFYCICSESLGFDVRKNRYFNKRISDLQDKEKVFLILYKKKDEFLLDYESKITNIKKHKTINKNYEIAVFTNTLNEYLQKYENITKEEENKTNNKVIAELDDYIDYESAMPKGLQVKPRKTIFDFND